MSFWETEMSFLSLINATKSESRQPLIRGGQRFDVDPYDPLSKTLNTVVFSNQHIYEFLGPNAG